MHLTVILLDENQSDIVSFDTYVSKVLSNSTKKININSKENLTNAKHIKITNFNIIHNRETIKVPMYDNVLAKIKMNLEKVY